MTGSKRRATKDNKDVNVLMRAVKAIKVENKTMRSTAREFKIPRSNLHRYVSKLDEQGVDFSAIKDDELLIKLRKLLFNGPPTVQPRISLHS